MAKSFASNADMYGTWRAEARARGVTNVPCPIFVIGDLARTSGRLADAPI